MLKNGIAKSVIFWMLVASRCGRKSTRNNFIMNLKSDTYDQTDFRVYFNDVIQWSVVVSRKTRDRKTIMCRVDIYVYLNVHNSIPDISVEASVANRDFNTPDKTVFIDKCNDIFKERNAVGGYALLSRDDELRAVFPIQDMTIDSILFTTNKLISTMLDTWRNHIKIS